MKWDGVRALALVRAGRVRLLSRNENDISIAYPEVQGLGVDLDGSEALLDGEIVAIDETGRASFQQLQSRMHLRDPTAVARIAAQRPVTFIIFDLLWKDGSVLTERPYHLRRELLADLSLAGAAWQTPPMSRDGHEAFVVSQQLGFEGIVSKRLDSRYEPGRRSRAWCKVKHQRRQEFVVGGWVPGQGNRANTIGALLLGYYTDGELRYAGKVGTGFTAATLENLTRVLAARATPSSPFSDRDLPSDAHFAEPDLVAEIHFTEWTESGRIRHPAYLGLRDDKRAIDVVREE
jgi:bifunctional non-homologous end joining protein LigD